MLCSAAVVWSFKVALVEKIGVEDIIEAFMVDTQGEEQNDISCIIDIAICVAEMLIVYNHCFKLESQDLF